LAAYSLSGCSSQSSAIFIWVHPNVRRDLTRLGQLDHMDHTVKFTPARVIFQ
jgi:hypothetical protein